MLTNCLIGLGFASLLSSHALAQTGRIAHFSHGGSAATLGAAQQAADNFGDPPTYFIADSIRYLSPTTALGYGHWSWRRAGNTDTMHLPQAMSKPAAARYWQQLFVNAKLTGFDSPNPTNAPPAKRFKRRPKRAAVLRQPARPVASLGFGFGLALLVSAGWLLAGKKPTRPQLT